MYLLAAEVPGAMFCSSVPLTLYSSCPRPPAAPCPRPPAARCPRPPAAPCPRPPAAPVSPLSGSSVPSPPPSPCCPAAAPCDPPCSCSVLTRTCPAEAVSGSSACLLSTCSCPPSPGRLPAPVRSGGYSAQRRIWKSISSAAHRILRCALYPPLCTVKYRICQVQLDIGYMSGEWYIA